MSDAEKIVRFAIFSGIVGQWHKKEHPRFAEIIRDEVFESLFAPHLKWAMEEYLKELGRAELVVSDKTFLGLIFTADDSGPGFQVAYGVNGCQDLRRNALYTWMKGAIEENKERDIDFLEIMVSVVEQLKEDGLI
jgi:hypothetical protein